MNGRAHNVQFGVVRLHLISNAGPPPHDEEVMDNYITLPSPRSSPGIGRDPTNWC